MSIPYSFQGSKNDNWCFSERIVYSPHNTIYWTQERMMLWTCTRRICCLLKGAEIDVKPFWIFKKIITLYYFVCGGQRTPFTNQFSFPLCVSRGSNSGHQIRGKDLYSLSHLTSVTVNPSSCLHLPRARITGMYYHIWVAYVMLGIELTASCMLGKHSFHWTIPPFPLPLFLNFVLILQ